MIIRRADNAMACASGMITMPHRVRHSVLPQSVCGGTSGTVNVRCLAKRIVICAFGFPVCADFVFSNPPAVTLPRSNLMIYFRDSCLWPDIDET